MIFTQLEEDGCIGSKDIQKDNQDDEDK